jgi:hypothetical protein
VSYGEGGLLLLARMMLRASQLFRLRVGGAEIAPLDADAPVTLRWPDWYPADPLDRQRDAETVNALVGAGQISRETGLKILAPNYDIVDVAGELARIASEADA